MKPSLYLETTVVSYLTVRPSRDVIVLAHQTITQQWWESHLKEYDIYISQVVVDEARLGDHAASAQRLRLIEPFPLLEITPDVERLAGLYLREVPLPGAALRDALHIAAASVHGMDYLLTWNCAHIAHGSVMRAVARVAE